jgi:tryptophan synthase alpha chain
MSGRIEATFNELATRRRKALVAYICVGYPSIAESIDLALECVAAGADVLELGNPFSDPTADGPAIARASQHAISAGGGLDATLRAAKSIRERAPAVPIVLFGYFNPLFVRGEAKAADLAADADVDALLVVDLPLEEGAELRTRAKERGLLVVPLIAPTSPPDRAHAVRERAAEHGFVYYVSVTGVTGSTAAPLAEASAQAARLREATGLPVVVGFGVDSPEKARAAGTGADGIVVGTALVREIEGGRDTAERKARVTRLVSALRAGLDTA